MGTDEGMGVTDVAVCSCSCLSVMSRFFIVCFSSADNPLTSLRNRQQGQQDRLSTDPSRSLSCWFLPDCQFWVVLIRVIVVHLSRSESGTGRSQGRAWSATILLFTAIDMRCGVA